MATTEHFYTGNGSTTTFAFTFPYLSNADVEVELNNVLKTENTSGQTDNDYTISNTNIVFNSAPGNGVAIHIYRTTNVDSAQAQYAAGSSIRAADLNNNQTQLLYSAQEAAGQLIRQSDLKDSIVTSAKIVDGSIATGDLADSLITTAKINADAVTGAKIADDQINSEHYVSGSIDTEHIADSQVTTAKIADSNVTTAKIADSNVTTAKIAADAITGAKIADDQINSEHYVDGSIDTAHIADSQITSAKIVDGTIVAGDLASNSVTTVKITDANVTTAKIADSNVTTAKIANSNVTTAKIAADNITSALIADDQINSEHYVDGSIDTQHIADAQITSAKLAANCVSTANIIDGAIATADIGDNQITTAKINADAVNGTKIADDSINSEHYVDGSIDTAHIAGAQVTDAKLASNSVTTSKITDANVTTVKVADANITLAKLASDLKQTSISNSDTQLPTSGAVVDYVAAQIAPIGGLEVIATDAAFPNTQPSAGVVISISDAGGVVVSGTSSNTGRTVGGSTVTINGFPSTLTGETIAAGAGLMVSSTGSGQVYNYHKLLAKEADVKQLSDDINDFASRYRVGSSNPTSSLDNGDLFFNTGSSKLLVYNGTTSAWEETQSVGNFFINTISSYSGTGGNSASFNGSAYRFVLSSPGLNAEQHIVSINGVIQKPNSGTSQPSEGFAIDGSSIIFSSAPVSGADFFIITIGAAVSIGTPSNNTVSTDVLTSGAVTTAKIADQAVTLAKLPHGDGSSNGKFLRANNGADPTFESVITDLVNDSSPQLGGDLDTNSFEILLDDSHSVKFGDGADLQIYHDGSHNRIDSSNGNIYLRHGTDNAILTKPNDSVSLYFDDSKKFETTSSGINVTGQADVDSINCTGELDLVGNLDLNSDSSRIKLGAGDDFQLYHNGSNNYIETNNGDIFITTSADNGDIVLSVSNVNGGFVAKTSANENLINAVANGAAELYHNGTKKFETTSGGATVTGSFIATANVEAQNNMHVGDNKKFLAGNANDLQIYHDGGDSYVSQTGTGNLIIQGNASNNIAIRAKSGEEGINLIPNGAVELYHDNALRFQTDANGTTLRGGVEHRCEGTFRPWNNNTYDLGSSADRWRNIYTNDLNLSNEGSSNDVDGTWGNWTIQEGESDLFLKNNRSGKKYKFNLTEVS